ncbi:uncharacterized protein LOC143429228 [Xylocopa sonorina]|uniref:uncharacterized protein LOC143429228 n=1 Tax=Xylocopa sonorina TaxID=1818115 RepID=UPI00403AC571
MENLSCDFGLKKDVSCPIDGGWTFWGAWGSCSGKCGFIGKQIRYRTCNNPAPSNNGAYCTGPSYQIKRCQIMRCTMMDYDKVVSIYPIRKEELKIVKKIHKELPALNELCFLVDCIFSIVEKVLGNNAMPYWNAMNCIKYNVGCPRLGGWSAWGVWSSCTAICGKGKKYRTRTCNSPIPSSTKLMCNDSAFEMENCLGFNCKNRLTGSWSNWSKWSMCSVECGSGIQIKKRFCSESQSKQRSSCKGSAMEVKGCAINNCSINGMWSSWTAWSLCTSTCGVGTQLRNRMCNNPSPSGNGTTCVGSASEVHQCFTRPCIGEGFQGQIQEIRINFMPVQLHESKDKYDKKYTNVPFSSNNVQHLIADDNEGFIYISLTDSVAVPCPRNMEHWQITIVIKPEDTNGVLAIIPDDSFSLNEYILLLLEEGKIKLKFHQGATYVAIESMEHILVGEWFQIILAHDDKNIYIQVNGNEKQYMPLIFEEMMTLSTSYIFLGAIRDDMREKMCPNCVDVPLMSFTLGYLNIDGKEIDLITLPVLETTSKKFSSRTISISDYYEEIPLFLGQELKLSCFYDIIPHKKRYKSLKRTHAMWLVMDRLLQSYEKYNDFFNIKDDGRVSTISIVSYMTRDTIENFYSCHIYHSENKSVKTLNQALFTFGITVIDKDEEFESKAWKEWSFIYGATIACFIVIIIWCLLEILQFLRNGDSFDRQEPQISNNNSMSTINFVLSKSGVTLLGSQQAANEVVSRILKEN